MQVLEHVHMSKYIWNASWVQLRGLWAIFEIHLTIKNCAHVWGLKKWCLPCPLCFTTTVAVSCIIIFILHHHLPAKSASTASFPSCFFFLDLFCSYAPCVLWGGGNLPSWSLDDSSENNENVDKFDDSKVKWTMTTSNHHPPTTNCKYATSFSSASFLDLFHCSLHCAAVTIAIINDRWFLQGQCQRGHVIWLNDENKNKMMTTQISHFVNDDDNVTSTGRLLA